MSNKTEMLLNYLDPETLLHLKETFPKCKPEYPHVERLPGLTFAYKSKHLLADNREYPNGFGSYNDGYGTQRVRSRVYRETSPSRPCQYNGVVILSLENHHPFSYESNDGEIYYSYNITHGNAFREPFTFPLVKPGDVFLRLQTWVSTEYFSNPDNIRIIERYIPAVAFITETYRIKYHHIKTKKTFKEAYDYYLPLRSGDPDGVLFSLVNDIRYGLISWIHPFDLWMVFMTMTDDDPRETYTNQEIRDICIVLGLPIAPIDVNALVWMCRNLLTYAGYKL